MADYIIAKTEKEYRAAAALFRAYADGLTIDLGFQHFEQELKGLKTMYAAPHGGVILCKIENESIACVAVRKIDNQTAELKRMFVRPVYRWQGIGKILMEKAIELAKAANYSCIRLDTLNYMSAAINLYKKNGFYEIPAYYQNPNATVVHFELKF